MFHTLARSHAAFKHSCRALLACHSVISFQTHQWDAGIIAASFLAVKDQVHHLSTTWKLYSLTTIQGVSIVPILSLQLLLHKLFEAFFRDFKGSQVVSKIGSAFI